MSSLTFSAPVRAGRVEPARVCSARPQSVRRREATPLRLTRRGRTLAVLVLLALVASAFLLLRAPATASTGEPGSRVATTVTVEPGQTLWQVALAARPKADPRETVARIMEMNGLTTATVQAGRQLYVPAG